ncbi:hypothetical protein LSAT2_026726, partial [Lamellibrachia satsuma]
PPPPPTPPPQKGHHHCIFLSKRCAQIKIFTAKQHKHTDEQYPGDNCTIKMANVRGLLVLSLVCLLLCQMMSLSEEAYWVSWATRKCNLAGCNPFCCHPKSYCHITCRCGWLYGSTS